MIFRDKCILRGNPTVGKDGPLGPKNQHALPQLFNLGPFQHIFQLYFSISLYLVDQFKMVNDRDRKQERIINSQTKSHGQSDYIDSKSEPKKAKSVPGFKPRLLGQNAVALPLEPPSLSFPQPENQLKSSEDWHLFVLPPKMFAEISTCLYFSRSPGNRFARPDLMR